MILGFINPPSPFLINQRVFISLGILRVATSINKKYDVKFLDLSDIFNIYDVIDNFIKINKIDVICITSTTPQIQEVYKISKYIKDKHKLKIILGGPHVTMMNSSMENGSEDIKNICYNHIQTLSELFDTIVFGDGEYAIYDAIEKNERIINSEKNDNFYLKHTYDEVAIANREYLDLNSYNYEIDGLKSTNIISQMGCPYRCEFCSGRGSKTFNKIRTRTTENILKEIDLLYKNYNYKGFMFYDDELNLNKKYFNTLLEELIKYQKDNKVEFNLRGFTRSDLLTEEQSKLMYSAGFRWLLIGFESGSDKILKNMNKGCTVNDNTKTFEIARKTNLKVKALMSIGHPGDSIETVNETINWLKYVKPNETDVSLISVYPGSNYFNKSNLINNELVYSTKTNENLFIDNIDFLKQSNFYKSKSDEYVSFVYTDYLNKSELIKQRLYMENEIKKIK